MIARHTSCAVRVRMKATEHLRHEHEIISARLKELLKALKPLNLEGVLAGLRFISDFVDGVHHAKEEQALFPALMAAEPRLAQGPISVMEQEHEMGRAFLRAARHAVAEAPSSNPAAHEQLYRSVRAFVDLVEQHIEKENNVLYPFAERVLAPSSDLELVRRFNAIQLEQMDPQTYQRFVAPAETPLPPTPHPSPAQASPSSFIDARTLGGDEPQGGKDEARPETVMTMRAGRGMFDDGHHRALRLHDFGKGLAVQANQFLIVDGDEGMVLDPGGPKVYPNVYAETKMRLGAAELKYIFLSHQDPDIGTSINAWMMDTKAEAIISRLWIRFLAHYGIDRYLEHRIIPIADEGARIRLGDSELMILPAHFLHSAGNFQLYDPVAKILFSGDVGASMGCEYSAVPDFADHVRYMAGFHRRYMCSNVAMRAWARMVRKLDIDIIAPQHGPMFKGKAQVESLIDWCEGLECGTDLLEAEFRIPPPLSPA